MNSLLIHVEEDEFVRIKIFVSDGTCHEVLSTKMCIGYTVQDFINNFRRSWDIHQKVLQTLKRPSDRDSETMRYLSTKYINNYVCKTNSVNLPKYTRPELSHIEIDIL